jgi:hypothetical protein
MPARPPAHRPARRRRKRTARVRELHRRAEARRRARERKGERIYSVCIGETGHEALIARSIDAGLSVETAERDARDRVKVSRDLGELFSEWANHYLAARRKNLV